MRVTLTKQMSTKSCCYLIIVILKWIVMVKNVSTFEQNQSDDLIHQR